MFGLKRFSVGAWAWAFLGSVIFAQTPTTISVVSGNGQVACAACTGLGSQLRVFEPMVVLVTDGQGNPAGSTAVNWSIVNGTQNSPSLTSAQTATASDGTSSNNLTFSFSGNSVYTVVASLPGTSSSVTFTLTTSAPETSNTHIFATITSGLYTTLTGTAGGTGSPNIQVQVQDFTGAPVPNVSLRLIPAPGYTPGASVSCATGAGADIGSALTDATGVATCTPVFGPIPGNGSFVVLVGGVANAKNGTGPIGYLQFPNAPIPIQVSAAAPSSMKIISGNPQTGNPGQALAAPLVAEVDGSGGGPVAGQTVTWSVTPAGAATLSTSTSTSDANGRVSTNVSLVASASGTVQVVASVSSSISVTFTINVNIQVTGLSKASTSGDLQTAAPGAAFSQPLVVQVSTAAGQSAANIPVQFTISGPGAGTLSATTASTNSVGQASVTVTAGTNLGAITVTAYAAGVPPVSFTLTVAPPGPQITSASLMNGAGFYTTDQQSHSALSPCAIGTVSGAGIAPTVQGVVTAPMFGPLPYQLAAVSIAFNASSPNAPLYNVANVGGQQQASFQVPCDVTLSESVPVTVTVSGVSKTVNVAVRAASPGIFQFTDSDGLQHAVLIHPDGSFVTISNPAHAGETLRMYATGMGPVTPPLATNAVPVAGTDSVAAANVVVALNNSGARVVSARRAPGLVGVDEVTFQIPSTATPGLGILYVAVGFVNPPGFYVSNTAWVTIQ